MTNMRSGSGVSESAAAASRPSRPAPAVSAISSPAEFWRMIRRHLLLVVVLFVVIAGTSVTAIVFHHKSYPRYEAEARIRVDPPATRERYLGAADPVPTQQIDQFIQTQVRLIQNNEILNRVFTDNFGQMISSRTTGLSPNERTIARDIPPGSPATWAADQIDARQRRLLGNRSEILDEAPEAAPVLREKLKISQVIRTNLISIRLEGGDRELIADAVNAVVDSYMLAVKEDRKHRNARRVEGLKATEDTLSRDLTQLQTRVQTFVQTHNMLFATAGQDLMQRLSLIEKQLVEAQGVLRQASILNEQMKRLAQQDLSETQIMENLTPEMLLRLDMDRELAILVNQKHELLRSKDSLLERLNEGHDAVRSVSTQIATVDAQVERRRKELARVLLDQQRLETASAYETAVETVRQLTEEYNAARQTVAQAVSRQTEYDNLRQQHDLVREQLNQVRTAIRDTEIASEISENVISIAEVARVPGPDERVGSPILYSGLSVVMAMAISLGLALMVELIDNRVRTPQQVVGTVQMPVLGVIPDGREDPATRSVSNLSKVAMNAPQSLFAESFRQLRTALLYSTDTDLKTLLVTSPQAEEGKTMVACNLAVTLANGGSKVLLVDTNFRRPAVHLQLDLQNTIGLSSVLARLSELDEAVQQTQVANLEVLSCGPLPPSPADLLGSQAMQDLLAKIRERYDAVIVDGPPMLLVADGHVLASMMDGVTVVISSRKTSRGVATRTKRMLQSLRARVVGAVLNRVRAQKGGYFRESFRAYYAYSGKQQ